MQFKDIKGQTDICNRLAAIADSGRVSHAQLLLGNTEDGSMQVAWAYLQYLCCEHHVHHPEGELHADSCGECPSCKKIATLVHPDLHLFFPNATNSRIKSNPSCAQFTAEYRQFLIDTQALGTMEDWIATVGTDNKQCIIREADADDMVQTLNMKPYEGGWKMVLVWMPERMNISAANKLLKTLEEPLGQTLLMLVGESDERMLATVKSRVQTIRLHSSTQKRKGELEMAERYAPLIVSWLRMLFKLKMKDLSAQVDQIATLEREQLKQLLGYCLDLIRDCYLNTAAGLPVDIGSGDEKFDSMFPRMITINNIEPIEQALRDAIFAIERNAYARITLMELSFRISKALKKR